MTCLPAGRRQRAPIGRRGGVSKFIAASVIHTMVLMTRGDWWFKWVQVVQSGARRTFGTAFIK